MIRLKHPRFGLETEFLLVDEAGQATNSADLLIEKFAKKRMGFHVRQEVSKCQIEIGAAPHRTVRKTTKGFLRSLDEVIKCADVAMYRAKEGGRNTIRF